MWINWWSFVMRSGLGSAGGTEFGGELGAEWDVGNLRAREISNFKK
jgi:hypothetical protein